MRVTTNGLLLHLAEQNTIVMNTVMYNSLAMYLPCCKLPRRESSVWKKEGHKAKWGRHTAKKDTPKIQLIHIQGDKEGARSHLFIPTDLPLQLIMFVCRMVCCTFLFNVHLKSKNVVR